MPVSHNLLHYAFGARQDLYRPLAIMFWEEFLEMINCGCSFVHPRVQMQKIVSTLVQIPVIYILHLCDVIVSPAVLRALFEIHFSRLLSELIIYTYNSLIYS